MASFENHIDQAKKNLDFLKETNSRNSHHWDWQVTVCFYVAVHLANAHLAKAAGLHYRTHEATKNSLSPYNPLSVCSLPEDIYLSYAKLEGLSRRARYLCNDDLSNKDSAAFFTYDKHFAKAIRNLDKVLFYFNNLYSLNFPIIEIICQELSPKHQLTIFKVKS